MKRLALALSFLAAVAAAPVQAEAAVDANKILAEVDRRAAQFDDQQYEAAMEIYNSRGKLTKTLRFDMVMKGLVKQLITFTAPGDVAGMKVLMQDADTLYVYSPEFKKVRRIAAHMQNQGFLGSAFTYEDMTQSQLSNFFNAKLGNKKGSETTLELTPKEGKTTTYKKLEVVIDATKGGVTKIRYYDGSGKQVREQLREGWKKYKGMLVPTRITMRNLKTGDHTVVKLMNVRVNTGVGEDLFSRRTLMRG